METIAMNSSDVTMTVLLFDLLFEQSQSRPWLQLPLHGIIILQFKIV